MGRRTRILIALAVALLAPPAAAAEPVAAPAQTAARALTAGEIAISPGRAMTLPQRGEVVRFARTYAGARVIGGGVAVRLDRTGAVVWTRGQRLTAVEGAWSASESDVVTIARRAAGRGPGTAKVERVVFAAPGMPARRAHVVTLPIDPATLDRPVLTVDGATGAVLRLGNATHRAIPRGRVFPENPLTTPTTEIVDLPLADGATVLANADFTVVGCPDLRECRELEPTVWFHTCTATATAVVNMAGDFTDYDYVADDEQDDPFAEVQAIHHAQLALDRVRALGLTTFTGPLDIIVNHKGFALGSVDDCNGGPIYSGTGELPGLANAAFLQGGDPTLAYPNDTIVFGQTAAVDFAYDGEVVYHEFGHAALVSIDRDIGYGFVDAIGYNHTQAALQESFPDQVAIMVSGDPVFGEYLGSFFGDGSPVRDHSETRDCLLDASGNRYTDSLALSGAIDEIRRASALSRDQFDGAMVAAALGLDAFADFASFAELFSVELGLAGGATAEADARAVFDSYRLLGTSCRFYPAARVNPYHFVPSSFDAFEGSAIVPGSVQFQLVLDNPATEISVAIGLVDSNDRDPSLAVVRRAGTPITWTLANGQLASDADQSEVLAIDDDRVGTVTFSGDFAAGAHYLQFTNAGISAQLYDVEISAVEIESGGCGCQGGGGGSGGGGFALLGMMVLAATRRRAG